MGIVKTSPSLVEAAARTSSPRGGWSRISDPLRQYGIIVAVVVLFVVLALASPNFFSLDNIRNVLDQNAYLAMAAFGATLVIIAGGFDLSAGSVFALTGVIAAWVTVHVDPVLGLVAGLCVGTVAGLLNGALTSGLHVHSFLITLALGIVAAGLAVSISNGFLINASESSTFTWLGQARVAGIPPSILLLVVAAAALTFLLKRTNFGRHVYAVGGNPVAARLAGVRVGRTVVLTFVISGLMASVAGLLETSRTGSGQADAAGSGFLALDAIAAVIVGGTSIRGGRGAIWRTVFGVLLIALIHNGMNLLNVAPQWQDIVTGVVIVLAVALNALTDR